MSVSYASQQPFVSSAPVPSIDLNLMASVLQQKQGLFDANYAKAQSQLSTISSLDMLRDDDKVYRDSKLNELTNNINSLSGDYSDPNISSQIDNSISSVYSDSRILNAISSTKSVRALQAGYQKMQTDPKMMKYFSDANYDADMAEVERYISSKDPADAYRGKSSPTLFSSYMPDLVKAAEKIKADGWQRLKDGTDGFYNIESGEVVSASKLANLLGILDSNQRSQMARDANYLWGKKLNLNPEELIGKINNSTEQGIKNTEEYIKNLEISKKTATVEQSKILEGRIAEYKQNLTSLKNRKLDTETQYKNYLSNGGSLEGLRFMAYEDDVSKTLGNLYSWSKTKEESKAHPYLLEKYKSDLRTNELAIGQQYRLEQIRETAKYKDGSANPYGPGGQLPPPLPNKEKTDLNTKNQLKFNNQLASQYETEINNIHNTNPEVRVYKAGLSALADGQPAIVPKDADDAIIKADIYAFGAMRMRKANTAPNVEAVWKFQNSLPVIESKVDKASLQNIKANIVREMESAVSVDDIRFTSIGISDAQFREDNGQLKEDNNFYVDVEVKQGGEYVKVGKKMVTEEYAKILSGGVLFGEKREQMIINRGVDETNHFSTIVQSKVNPKAAFKITVAKTNNGYESFIDYEGKAIPLYALDSKIPKGAPYAWTALEAAREYLKNTPSKESIGVKVKNYIPSATEKLPDISFSNNTFFDVKNPYIDVLNKNPNVLQGLKQGNIDKFTGNRILSAYDKIK